jgi:hypothetical protein
MFSLRENQQVMQIFHKIAVLKPWKQLIWLCVGAVAITPLGVACIAPTGEGSDWPLFAVLSVYFIICCAVMSRWVRIIALVFFGVASWYGAKEFATQQEYLLRVQMNVIAHHPIKKQAH